MGLLHILGSLESSLAEPPTGFRGQVPDENASLRVINNMAPGHVIHCVRCFS